jgi:iron complex outermembrane recepter protein
MRYRAELLCGAVLFVTTAFAVVPAAAQDDHGTAIEEVVVTARKREENLQTVPVAVSVMGAAELTRRAMREPSDLARSVPSLRMESSNAQTNTGAIINLRGQVSSDVLLTLSQPVGFYLDNVNIPHAVGTNVSFFDLQRVEVLKGPQGTLYGRNTTGGAINLITWSADYEGVHGYVLGEVGNFQDRKVEAAGNFPLVGDMLSARLAFQHWERDGFGRSAVTGQRFGATRDDVVMRASVRFDLSPSLSGNLKLEKAWADRTDLLYQTRVLINPALADQEWRLEGSPGGVPPSVLVNNRDLFTNFMANKNWHKYKGTHAVLDWSWDLTDAVTLRSITGYHQVTDFHVSELGGMPIQTFGPGVAISGRQPAAGFEARRLLPDQEYRVWTQELNFSGRVFDDRLSWLVGAFASDDHGNQNQTASVYPPAVNASGPLGPFDVSFYSPTVYSASWAVYTQNDFKFTDIWSVTAGLRYTEDRLKQNVGFMLHLLTPGRVNPFFCQAGPARNTFQASEQGCVIAQHANFNGTSYLLSLNGQLTPSTLVYAKTAKGYRGGALQVRAPANPPAQPETATDYEIGLKTDLFSRRLRVNLAAFQTNYKNKQETAIVTEPSTGAQFTPIINAANARIRGFEAELTGTPIKGLTLNANFGYLRGKYQDYPGALTRFSTIVDGTGASFANPKFTYDLAARYLLPIGEGELGLSANYSYKSKIPTTILNDDPRIPRALQDEWRESIGVVNATIDYHLPDSGLTVAVFATNLLDKEYQSQSLTFGTYGYTGTTEQPRMWGVSVRKSFGRE